MRKPIDLEIKGLQTPRERIWSVLMSWQADTFTIDDIHGDVRPTLKRSVVIDYFKALHLGGWIDRVSGGGEQRTTVTYKLLQKAFEAPRVSKTGQPVTQGTAQLAMWRCMRVLKAFNAADLSRAASVDACQVPESAAKSYIKHLSRAGYLSPANAGSKTTWRLARNTGPHAPAITRLKVVFDRNTGTFAELQTAQETTDELE